jgi:RNA polymerase sigma-70 factor (ECF subfamily)
VIPSARKPPAVADATADAPADAPADPEAVAALWEASSRRLRAWFRARTGSTHDADDLVQETFLRVQARLGTLRQRERLDAWVGAIAANVLADHGRARAARAAREGRTTVDVAEVHAEVDAGGHGGDGRDGADGRCAGVADGELRRAVAGWLEAFLDRLEPDDAAILRAVDLHGRPQVDVARELGLSPSGARSRVQRARARLRRALEDCCTFAFDARGNLLDARRRGGGDCGCSGG